MGFEPTHWSIIQNARSADAGVAKVALEKLCSTYWPAIYSYVRSTGSSPADAQDLTQEFLARLIEKEWLCRLKDRRGKFRSFLLTLLKHFLSDERDKASAMKRGGGCTIVPLDSLDSEERGFEPANNLTPDRVYAKRWMRSLMCEAERRLQAEYESRGKGELYAVLTDLDPGKHGGESYCDIGGRFGMTEQAVKSAVHSVRRRYLNMLRSEVSRTVTNDAEADEEMRALLAAM